MNYAASISDFFKSPKWMSNILLGGICVLIPLVGPAVVLGWLATGFFGRQEEDYETFPPFDFSLFGKYLERGLWPFLVSFVVGIVLVPFVWIMMIPVMLLQGLAGSEGNSAALAIVGVILMILFWVVVIVGMMLVLTPLMLRATLTQDFAKAFDLRFLKRFLALTWKEILLTSLFVAVAGTAFSCVGMLAACVGMYFAAVVVYFSWEHLQKQLYNLYLSRGGERVPLSPKLIDGPPPIPASN